MVETITFGMPMGKDLITAVANEVPIDPPRARIPSISPEW